MNLKTQQLIDQITAKDPVPPGEERIEHSAKRKAHKSENEAQRLKNNVSLNGGSTQVPAKSVVGVESKPQRVKRRALRAVAKEQIREKVMGSKQQAVSSIRKAKGIAQRAR